MLKGKWANPITSYVRGRNCLGISSSFLHFLLVALPLLSAFLGTVNQPFYNVDRGSTDNSCAHPSMSISSCYVHWLSSLSHFVCFLIGSLDRSPASYSLKGPFLMPPSEPLGCRTQAAFIHALLPADHKPRHCARRPKIVETGEERFAGNLSRRHATNARLTYFLFSRPLFWNEQLHNLVHQEKGFWFIFCHKPKEYYCVSNQPWELEFMNM